MSCSFAINLWYIITAQISPHLREVEGLELHRGPYLPEDLLHRVDQLWPDAVAGDQGALELLLLLVQLVGLDLGGEKV